MKRLICFAISALSLLWGNAEYNPQYYSAMDGKRKEALKAAAKECVSAHQQLVYMDLPNYWQYSDVYPEKYDGQTRWWEMYSNRILLIRQGQSAKSSFSANGMNREHSVPKSWWKVGSDEQYTPAYSDMWNLYPSESEANMAKSNYPLGIVGSDVSYDNGCTKVGVPQFGYGGGAGKVFEPADEYKGDFARGFFYMATVYDDIYWQTRYNWMFTRASYPTLQPWAYEMLLEWSRQDPVSQKEILRNDAVEKSQGNRNPFVDFPMLAEYIWGKYTGEVFYVAEQGTGGGGQITGDPELTLPVNNETLDFGEVALQTPSASWLVLKGKNFVSPISLTIGGADRDMFKLESNTISGNLINTTGEYMLPIIYTPSTAGEHKATLSIYDGGLASSIRVNLRGTGCEVPELTTPHALPPADVTTTTYRACWEEVPETVDYYVVYRTRYLADGEETDEMQADGSSLLITGRDASVAESYRVASSRLGFLSGVSNTVMVESSGVNDIYTEPTANIGWVEGGFIILTEEESIETLQVYDLTGRMVRELHNLRHGDFIPMPAGAYLICAPQLGKPVKYLN